jgi:hypothetical protein
MKKVFMLALAGLVLLSSVLIFPLAVSGHDVNECYRDHQVCRERALNLNAPWTKVALVLTVCDIALGKCILALKV